MRAVRVHDAPDESKLVHSRNMSKISSMPEATAYIALGSNLERPLQQLQNACAALAALAECRFNQVSSWYRSKAIGPGEQPDYINAVCSINTRLDAHSLLHEMQSIENNQGRIRRQRWAARTLDLDLLLYGSECINTPDLQVPHPRLHERNFVLYPLFEIAPGLVINTGAALPKRVSLESLLAQVNEANLERLNSEYEW